MKNLNKLLLGILAISFAACANCHSQNGFMLTTVADFNDPLHGDPVGFAQGSDGMLYGVTPGEGFGGTIFRTTLDGVVTTLVSFNGTNGYEPDSPPVQAADGNIYGTTHSGGPDWNTTNDFGNFFGTVYRMGTNGVLTTLWSFNQTNGSYPATGGLSLGNDGALYGVTYRGGADFTDGRYNPGDGLIYRITTNGDFTLLASFYGSNGSWPNNIIQASDGNFYGTTLWGGLYGDGTLFRMTPDGQVSTLLTFNGTNGEAPDNIIQGSDGCLYGTTLQGGASYTGANPNFGNGTVFKITTNGDFTLLASFDGTNGASPSGGLTEVRNGVFYGTAAAGGQYTNALSSGGNGTFFQITTNGNLTVFLSFGANSLLPWNPNSTLIRASDGNFYGTADGPNTGSIFSIRPIQAPILQTAIQSNQFNLTWNAWLGYSYAVMYETNLTGSNWNLLSTVTPQTNGPASFSDPIAPDTQRFYQVILQLP
jgi:uncharacterized repeat protein (TIGR03803 family)